jgi:CelD/BcsL family acetyltransferase involved in cellulose biosynthesis
MGARVAAPAVEVHESFTEVAREWDELADRVDASPFTRPGWFEAWEAAFADERPLVLALRDGDRLTAVAPLLRDPRGLRSPTNSHTPSFGFVAEDDAAARQLVDQLLARRDRRVALDQLEIGGEWHRLVVDAAAGGHRTVARRVARSPYVAVTGDWASYEAGLERKFRKELGRMARNLERDHGEVRLGIGDGSEDLEAQLDEGFRLEASGWKLDEGVGILGSPKRVEFYRRLAEWARDRGWLRLSFLYAGDRAVAFDYCLEHSGTVYALKGGYDPELRRYGPGMLLTRASLVRAFESGLSAYELLGTDDPYKLRFTTLTRDRARLEAFPRGIAGSFNYAAFRYARPLAVRLRGERVGELVAAQPPADSAS